MMNHGMPAALLLLAVFWNATSALAEEGAGVRLLRPDSLPAGTTVRNRPRAGPSLKDA